MLALADQGDTARPDSKTPAATKPDIRATREVFDTGLGSTVTADIIDRGTAPIGATFTGPALVTEAQTTTYVPPGFSATINANGHLIIERQGQK